MRESYLLPHLWDEDDVRYDGGGSACGPQLFQDPSDLWQRRRHHVDSEVNMI